MTLGPDEHVKSSRVRLDIRCSNELSVGDYKFRISSFLLLLRNWPLYRKSTRTEGIFSLLFSEIGNE